MRPGVNGVTLSVIDQGRGIPPTSWKPFSDGSAGGRLGFAAERRSGLGLAICAPSFCSTRAASGRNAIRSAARPFESSCPTSLCRRKRRHVFDREAGEGTVLLADANGATRPQIAAQLTRHGYRVIETATVEHTLAAAHGRQAILLDTSLDGMNGWRFFPCCGGLTLRQDSVVL